MFEPIHFRSNQGKVLLLQAVSVDDHGLIMKSAMGIPFQEFSVGDQLIDPDGTNYRISGMSIRSNVLWLEQY